MKNFFKNSLFNFKSEFNKFNILFISEIFKYILYVLLIIFSILAFEKTSINKMLLTNQVLEANLRAYWLIFLLISFLLTCINLYYYVLYLNNSTIKKVIVYSFTIFSFIYIKDLYLIYKKNKSLKLNSFNFFKLCFINNVYFLKYLFILVFIIFCWTTFSFLTYPILLIFLKDNGTITINNSYVFSIISYFTELTNFGCFIFLLLILITKKVHFLFNKLTLIINLTSYILVVMVVFWASRIPSLISSGTLLDWNYKLAVVDNVQTIFLHFIDPISFLVFAIFIKYFFNNNKKENYGRQYLYFLIYPLVYAFYLYSICYLVPYSVYGPLTNVNENLVNDCSSFVNQSNNEPGNRILYLGILLIWLVLTIMFTIIYFSFHIKNKQNRSLIII